MNTPIQWQKSSFSGGGGAECVEVATHQEAILIRESDDPAAVIATSASKWEALISGVKTGHYSRTININ